MKNYDFWPGLLEAITDLPAEGFRVTANDALGAITVAHVKGMSDEQVVDVAEGLASQVPEGISLHVDPVPAEPQESA